MTALALQRANLHVPDPTNARLFTGAWHEQQLGHVPPFAPQHITVTWPESYLVIPFSLRVSFDKLGKRIDVYSSDYGIDVRLEAVAHSLCSVQA